MCSMARFLGVGDGVCFHSFGRNYHSDSRFRAESKAFNFFHSGEHSLSWERLGTSDVSDAPETFQTDQTCGSPSEPQDADENVGKT